jgi:energy-coupling factor transporter ATP-binding protein EcfA2
MNVSPSDGGPMIGLYRQRMTDFDRRKKQLERRADWISHARVAAFLASGACLLAGSLGWPGKVAWLAAGGLLSIAFVGLVWLHKRAMADATRFWQLCGINRQAAARQSREWKRIPVRAYRAPVGEEAVAVDLDLFGEASLFQLLCTANTSVGICTLGQWLLHPADPATVVQRQQAVAELAPAVEMRQELERRGLKVAAHKNLDQFLRWAEAEPWLERQRWLRWASWLVPSSIPACLVLAAMGVLPSLSVLVPVMINVVMGSVRRRRMHEIFGFVSTRQGEVGDYAGLFRLMVETPVASALLTRLQQQTAAEEGEAWREIQRLGRIADLANVRFSEMSHFLVQSLLSWDFHVLALLERWQRRYGRGARRWFEALAEWEALASLAALAHDNPTWAFPVIENQPDGKQTLRARSLGHPLIPDTRRVDNDVTIGPPGTFLLVTGSNMSGKSTLLRAVGVNVILAQAGGPVCAAEFRMPPVALATSMRIRDSLAEGVSYYLAGLKRLKEIVQRARSQPADSGGHLLYLLDEILQGTNTAERQIAVRRVLAHLLGHGAIGAVSTHDLQLAVAPPLAGAVHAVHFRETIHSESGRQEMTFDYTLREGSATTSNALKLLEMVGLNDACHSVDTVGGDEKTAGN